MKFTKYVLPAHWASALINGDDSGMRESEIAEMDAWLQAKKPGLCVGCSDEEFFCCGNDANNLGANCLTFYF